MATDAPERDAASDDGPGSPNYNPDFEAMGISDPSVVATLERVWTLLLRGYESPKFPEITERTLLPLLYDVYLHPEGGPLTGDEAQDLEVWIDALGDAREPARAFTDADVHRVQRAVGAGAGAGAWWDGGGGRLTMLPMTTDTARVGSRVARAQPAADNVSCNWQTSNYRAIASPIRSVIVGRVRIPALYRRPRSYYQPVEEGDLQPVSTCS